MCHVAIVLKDDTTCLCCCFIPQSHNDLPQWTSSSIGNYLMLLIALSLPCLYLKQKHLALRMYITYNGRIPYHKKI